jgi:uncharacterized protein (TIGR01777 family)
MDAASHVHPELQWKDSSGSGVFSSIMKIIISGSSGLVGTALVPNLTDQGHEVVRLVRPPHRPGESEATWNPAKGELDPAVLDGADVVINLNGRSIGEGRWNAGVKDELRTSRLDATRTIVAAIAGCEKPPPLLINASAVGYYGDRGDEVLDEKSQPGTGFLADLSRDWEQAAFAAASNSTRVVLLRFGMIIADGGALQKMLLPFKLGLGGPMGSGRQFWPWVAMADVLGVIRFAMDNPAMTGPVNVVSPRETRCSDFTRTLGSVLRRPAVLPMPAFAARLALGEMGDALLLASQRVRPRALEEAGYPFENPELDLAIRSALS